MHRHDKKSIQQIHLTTDQNPKTEFVSLKNMQTIRCICGSEILVVPDLKAMNCAIKNHVAQHKQAKDGSDRIAFLENFLTGQVLIVAGQQNKPNLN